MALAMREITIETEIEHQSSAPGHRGLSTAHWFALVNTCIQQSVRRGRELTRLTLGTRWSQQLKRLRSLTTATRYEGGPGGDDGWLALERRWKRQGLFRIFRVWPKGPSFGQRRAPLHHLGATGPLNVHGRIWLRVTDDSGLRTCNLGSDESGGREPRKTSPTRTRLGPWQNRGK